MLRVTRRRTAEAGVQFCDSCAEVTTAAQRAERRHDRIRSQAMTWMRPL